MVSFTHEKYVESADIIASDGGFDHIQTETFGNESMKKVLFGSEQQKPSHTKVQEGFCGIFGGCLLGDCENGSSEEI